MTERFLPSLDDLDRSTIEGVAVFVRADLNVPLEDGRVADAARIEAALPTISELCEAGARTVVASHCGRPDGARVAEFSLRPVAGSLAGLLGRHVAFAEDCIGETARAAIEAIEPGGVCLLENLRYHPGETANDPAFAGALAESVEIYVGEAFGAAHRAHASVVGVPSILGRNWAGRLMVAEVTALRRLLDQPRAPFVALLGGAKISGKMDTIRNLMPSVDTLGFGGGMANTFLAALGHDLADSLVESDRLDMASELLELARAHGVRLLLPEDLVVTDDLEAPTSIDTVPVDAVPAGAKAVDIGPHTRSFLAEAISTAGTIFWNGPMGVFEKPPFDRGTVEVASVVAASDGYSVIGGGETVAAARRAGVTDRIDHISTGGGASLEMLAGKTLPGVAILEVER